MRTKASVLLSVTVLLISVLCCAAYGQTTLYPTNGVPESFVTDPFLNNRWTRGDADMQWRSDVQIIWVQRNVASTATTNEPFSINPAGYNPLTLKFSCQNDIRGTNQCWIRATVNTTDMVTVYGTVGKVPQTVNLTSFPNPITSLKFTFQGVTQTSSGDYPAARLDDVSIEGTPKAFTATFDAQGGSAPSPASKSVTYNTAYGALATTSRTAYTLNGWYTAPTGGTLVTAATTVTTTSNHTLYAQWTASNYTATFDAQGGSAPSPASKFVTYNAAYGTLATTSRTGYTLDGWFSAPTGGTQVTAGTTVTTASDHTLYAQWTANSYTVTFDANGGDAAVPDSQSATYDDTYGALATTSRTGHAFDGWFSAPTGGTQVTAGTTVTTASDHTLYAQWTANSYTVTFDANGGDIAVPDSQSATYDDTYGALATTSRTGYTFDGWFSAPTGGTQVTDGTTVTTASDHTLYAQWTANSYTVTFDANGGDVAVPDSQSATYDDTYGALATTSRTGYTFDGWFSAPAGGTQVTAGTTVTTASDHTLYAQWTIITYTVDYVDNPVAGGSASGAASIAHTGAPGDSIPVTVIANTGWSVDIVSASNGNVVFDLGDTYILSNVTANTTVTASFIEDGEGEGASEGEGTFEGEGATEGEGEGTGEGEGEGEGEALRVDILGLSPIVATVGDSHTFVVTVAGATGSIGYQWLFNSSAKEFEIIPGANDAEFSIAYLQIEDTGHYVCQVSDDAAVAESAPVELIVLAGIPVAGAVGLALITAFLAALGAVAMLHRKSWSI
jgi:uncharacterized repeat protein (TIGR02543 family)